MLGLSDDAIDRLLAEAESRLASHVGSKAVAVKAAQPVALGSKSALAVASPVAPSTGEGTAVSETQPEKLAVRVPQLAQKKKKTKDDAGSDWYNMPRTNLTPQLRRDLQILRLRDVVAMGKQFFKKDNKKDFVPEFSQVGTIVAGATDGSNQRLTRKERKQTIVEEVLAGAATSKFKSKYSDIQEKNQSGKKGHYKKAVGGRKRRTG